MTNAVFALKAALADPAQLDARAAWLASVGRPIVLELHTFGARDIDTAAGLAASRATVARLRERHAVERLIVHVPVQQVPVVTQVDFDAGQCQRAIAFAAEIGAEAVVIHRYFELVFGDAPPRAFSKPEAIRRFNAIIRDLARLAPEIRLLVENIGHYSLLPRDGRNYLSGPLDHFFPWEIRAFRRFCAQEGLANVEPFVDVAHATLSANLFNRRKLHFTETADDPRFAWITPDDLDQAERLAPFDFVDPAMSYLHVSDASLLDAAELAEPNLPEARLVEGIVSEGLEIGTGNLPFARLPERLGQGTPTLVLEVEPGAGETHVDNGAQLRSLEGLAALFDQAPAV
jgi:hypothetical protein